MKSFFLVTTAITLIASTAHAGEIKFEYNDNRPNGAPTAKSDTVKAEYVDTLAGPVNYKIETVVTQTDKRGPVSGQFTGKIAEPFAIGSMVTVQPVVEYGRNFSATSSKTGEFYGLEAKLAVKTPLDGLTVGGGYRIRHDLGSVVGQNVNRTEVNAEYALTKKYKVGVVYYKNTGDTTSNVTGVYTKVKF